MVTIFDHADRLIDRLSERLHDQDVRAAKLIDELASVRADAKAQVASVRQEAANRIATISGELSVARHDRQLRSGRIGALRELLRINDSIDLDGSPKQGTRLTALAKLYFSQRRSLFAAGLRRVHALRAKNPVVEREPADLPPMEEIAPYTITMLVADDRIDRRVLLSARSLHLAGWKVAVIAVPYPDLIDHDQVEFPELAISRIDTTRAVSLPLDALSEEDHYAQDWHKVYFYHYHFLAAALRNPATVYVAHDLPVLAAAAAAAKQVGAALVYDAHELYPEQYHFGSELTALYSKAEAVLIREANLVTTVNQSIAREMAVRYDIEQPQVILNAAAVPAQLALPNDLLRQDLRIPDDKRVLLYQGALSINRNLENLVAAMSLVENDEIVLAMMGPGMELRQQLEAIAQRNGTLGLRVFFRDPVPQSVLLSYTSSADIGIVPYPPIDLNSRYCTPNKLFEFIVAGLPILANDLPELRTFVHDNGFGQVHPLDGPAETARAIEMMFASDLEVYRRRLAERRHEFVWNVQGEKLVSLYRRFAVQVDESIAEAA
jgi:glycosyltransferase involved in cell wall biosynthesis